MNLVYIGSFIPVLAVTKISSNFLASAFLLDRSVPAMAAIKPIGMEMMPGLASGNNGSPTNIAAPSTGDQTLGLRNTSNKELTSPTNMPVTAPVVLKRFQNTVKTMMGRLALAATAKASETRKATFMFWANKARMMERMDTPMDAQRAATTCSLSVA